MVERGHVVSDEHPPCKWVSRSSRWKEKLQKLQKLCQEQPEKLVQEIGGQICMCTLEEEDFLIAKGSDGTVVYLGFITNDGREVAVKTVEKRNDQRHNQRVDDEVNALAHLSSHPNIVTYMTILRQGNVRYQRAERCVGSDEPKPGTKGWRSKEVVLQENEQTDHKSQIKYKKSGDIQVAGMICYYIMTQGKHPYAPLGQNNEIEYWLGKGQPDLSPIQQDSEAYDLISSMLAHDPKERPSAEQLQRYAYLQGNTNQPQILAATGSKPEKTFRLEDNFEALECVGKGQDGVVLKGRHKMGHQDYAIKCIPHYRSEPVQIVQREIKALTELDPSRIVRYYDSWIDHPPSDWLEMWDFPVPSEDPREATGAAGGSERSREQEQHDTSQMLCIQMEFCQGTLKDWLSANPHRERLKVHSIFRRIVEAVHFVHEHHFMHRNLK
ncbi:hypothetical protein LSAT2_026762, partial [Lamellibrachia satsuma]